MKKKPRLSLLPISVTLGAVSAFVMLYLTKGTNYFIFNIKPASLTGYETSPISIAKWELGILIFVMGIIVYNYNQNFLEKKNNTEWSYVLIGLMTQGAILAIGAY